MWSVRSKSHRPLGLFMWKSCHGITIVCNDLNAVLRTQNNVGHWQDGVRLLKCWLVCFVGSTKCWLQRTEDLSFTLSHPEDVKPLACRLQCNALANQPPRPQVFMNGAFLAPFLPYGHCFLYLIVPQLNNNWILCNLAEIQLNICCCKYNIQF